MGTFEGNKANYIGREIEKIDKPNFKGVISDSGNYEDKPHRHSQARRKRKKRMIFYRRTSGDEVRTREINVSCAY